MGSRKRCGGARQDSPSRDGAAGRSLLMLAVIDTAAFAAAAWLCLSLPESFQAPAPTAAAAAAARFDPSTPACR